MLKRRMLEKIKLLKREPFEKGETHKRIRTAFSSAMFTSSSSTPPLSIADKSTIDQPKARRDPRVNGATNHHGASSPSKGLAGAMGLCVSGANAVTAAPTAIPVSNCRRDGFISAPIGHFQLVIVAGFGNARLPRDANVVGIGIVSTVVIT